MFFTFLKLCFFSIVVFVTDQLKFMILKRFDEYSRFWVIIRDTHMSTDNFFINIEYEMKELYWLLDPHQFSHRGSYVNGIMQRLRVLIRIWTGLDTYRLNNNEWRSKFCSCVGIAINVWEIVIMSKKAVWGFKFGYI